jgi:hypothetical protein
MSDCDSTSRCAGSIPLLTPEDLKNKKQKVCKFTKERTVLIKSKKRKLTEVALEFQPAHELENKRHAAYIAQIKEMEEKEKAQHVEELSALRGKKSIKETPIEEKFYTDLCTLKEQYGLSTLDKSELKEYKRILLLQQLLYKYPGKWVAITDADDNAPWDPKNEDNEAQQVLSFNSTFHLRVYPRLYLPVLIVVMVRLNGDSYPISRKLKFISNYQKTLSLQTKKKEEEGDSIF